MMFPLTPSARIVTTGDGEGGGGKEEALGHGTAAGAHEETGDCARERFVGSNMPGNYISHCNVHNKKATEPDILMNTCTLASPVILGKIFL